MSVRIGNINDSGVFFITLTCARWKPLFQITGGYHAVYRWFDYLRQQGHYIVAYVIMPNHLHVVIAFQKSEKPVNMLVGNGKRFMAYELVKLLRQQVRHDILEELSQLVNGAQRLANKKHEVFEPSFDRKECRTIEFTKQKADYIHLNPCKSGLAKLPEDYLHSSAGYYYTGTRRIYSVITYLELQDIELNL